MTRTAVAALLTAVLATGGRPLGIPEKLLFNPAERTSSGLAALERGELDVAAERLATAGRLAPQDPLARYNDGTAKLLSGDAGAPEVLQAAADMATADLAPAAQYNLGNSWLAQGELGAAIAAYEEALRAEPGLAAAKHNLELALRMRDEERRRHDQEGQEQEQEQETGDEQDSAGDGSPEPQGREDEPESEEREKAGRGEGEPPPDELEAPGGDPEPLPGFEPQADMTPEQAAAILEAVENLEREQRREAAAERARQQPGGGKDW